MPSVYPILQMRQRRYRLDRRSPFLRIGLILSGLISLAATTSSILLALAYAELTQGLPSPQLLSLYLEAPDGLLLQPTRFYDRSGEHILLTLDNPAATGRPALTFDESQENFLPAPLISATLAALDPGFWQSPGYSLAGVIQGDHPTLAQRLVSDLLLWEEPAGLRRALRERLLAAQVTAEFGREQVLRWYLNSANYGSLAYGADAAARVYFGKPAADLTLAESATLAGTALTPGLNPLSAPVVARENQKQVLEVMLDQGLITPEQEKLAHQERPRFQPALKPDPGPAPAFLNLALAELEAHTSPDRLERGGLKVITTLDYDLQTQAECAALTQIGRLENNPEDPAPAGDPACPAASLLPALTTPALPPFRDLDADVSVLDPVTGQVLSLVTTGISGSVDASQSESPDGAITGLRHPTGTLLAPFIYLSAFTQGMSPASLVWDIPPDEAATGEGETPDLAPGLLPNLDGRYHGPLRLRVALANDMPQPALQTLEQVGTANVIKIARQMGLSSSDFSNLDPPAQLLSEGEVTLLEVSQAYGVIANQGVLAGTEATASSPALHPVTILKVEDIFGETWYEGQQVIERPVVSPQLAYLVTHILSDETARWSGLGYTSLLQIGRPAAVKIGRTADEDGAWTVGYTPQRVSGVWLGRRDGQETGVTPGSVSAEMAAALWRAVALYASQDLPPEGWSPPSGINSLEVCDPSGLLPTSDCPATVREVFLTGSEPTQADTLYKRLQINRETGLLATVFTPPELVQDRVFLVVPPEAEDWARLTGLTFPPESYDVIFGPLIPSPEVQITSPSMFSAVKGEVRVYGSASGEEFERYQLQAGKGMNPQQWVQISQDTSTPIREGVLGVWDTQGLSGLYSLQLLVVRQDRRVETAVIQVTVDNQAPEVEVPYPANGQMFSRPRNGLITLQADASDDLGIESVEFFIDGRSIAQLMQPPYALPWESQAGNHSFLVRVTDRAGNIREAQVQFTVEN